MSFPRGSWTSSGQNDQRRGGHIAVRLRSGKVLIAGGRVGHRGTDSAELYDPATGKFTPISSLTARRGRPGATVLTNGENVGRKSARECAGWRAPAGFAANTFYPCKWLNLTKMVEISQCEFRNFSAPERFQCVEEISRERA